MSTLKKVREEREHFIRGGSLEEVGKAVDDFIATPLEEGWRLEGVDVGAHVSSAVAMRGSTVRVSTGFTATIHTVRTDLYQETWGGE